MSLLLSMQTMEEEVKEKPKRRPLVRAASEESSSDLSSVSYAPSPGDTLPWNLPKHHRIKRSKSASGDVLDPAERAVIRIAGTVFTQTGNWSRSVCEGDVCVGTICSHAHSFSSCYCYSAHFANSDITLLLLLLFILMYYFIRKLSCQ